MGHEIVQAVGVLYMPNRNKVLLVEHTESAGHLTGTHGLPSGRVNSDESKIQAAARELQEETGLETFPRYLKEYPNNVYYADIPRKDGEISFEWTVFICKKAFGILQESEETIPKLVNLDKVDSLSLLPNVKNAINDGLKYIENS